MTVAYEAIIFHKDGQLQSCSSNPVLKEAFGTSGKFNGQLDDNYPTATPVYASYVGEAQPSIFSAYTPNPSAPVLRTYASTVGEGPLSAQGQFNFGDMVGSSPVRAARASASDLSVVAATNSAVATSLNLAQTATTVDPTVSAMMAPYRGSGTINTPAYDVAMSAINAAGSANGRYDTSYVGDAVVQGVMASSLISGGSPRDHILEKNPANRSTSSIKNDPVAYQKLRSDLAAIGVTVPEDPTVPTVEQTEYNRTKKTGLLLSSQAFGLLNAQRPATSQIGFNSAKRER
jgi:hypothetical protein